jgi:hypothetical protein
MGVLNDAEKASGVSFIEAVAESKLGSVVQGVLYVGLKAQGVAEIDGEPLSYALIGEVCDFAEARDNTIAFMRAMAPETPAAKNAPAEDPKEPSDSPGANSGATATESSS